MFQRNVRQSANYVFRAIERRASWQLRERHEISLVLCGNESGGNAREAENGNSNQSGVNHHSNQAGTQRVRYKFSIAARRPAKEPVEQFEKPAEDKINDTRETIFLRIVRLQQKGRQRRTQ